MEMIYECMRKEGLQRGFKYWIQKEHCRDQRVSSHRKYVHCKPHFLSNGTSPTHFFEGRRHIRKIPQGNYVLSFLAGTSKGKNGLSECASCPFRPKTYIVCRIARVAFADRLFAGEQIETNSDVNVCVYFNARSCFRWPSTVRSRLFCECLKPRKPDGLHSVENIHNGLLRSSAR